MRPRPINSVSLTMGKPQHHQQHHLWIFLATSIVLVLVLHTAAGVHADQHLPRGDDGPSQNLLRARALVAAERFRRHTSAKQQQVYPTPQQQLQQEQALQQPQQQELQPAEGDEQALRRQLPDLLAQAHEDRNAERALLRLLINASLRSGLSNLVGQQQPSAGWQLDSLEGTANNLAQYNQANAGSAGEFVPIRLTRLEQNDLANLDGNELAGSAAGLIGALAQADQSLQQQSGQFHLAPQQQQFGQSASVDKREYIKPCSFNAISCVRTPFRKLK